MGKRRPGRGGARPGAGRPPLYDLPVVRKTIGLPPGMWKYLEQLGRGNATRGLRRLIEQAQHTED